MRINLNTISNSARKDLAQQMKRVIIKAKRLPYNKEEDILSPSNLGAVYQNYLGVINKVVGGYEAITTQNLIAFTKKASAITLMRIESLLQKRLKILMTLPNRDHYTYKALQASNRRLNALIKI